MAYRSLYRKYRPAVFSDVIGQEHITSVLKSEVLSGTVSHAYLFCGSRGTGKTTCAKILAKAVSCEAPVGGDPCGKCPCCLAAENTLDIYEIDAASYNGIENIRELRDTVAYPPGEMKRRVYIIDEVHALSNEAFNALLKTLEEPPSHVLFILATTELQKIPATILSRCKRFDFHRITPEKIKDRLRMVSDKENIKITDPALMLIARLASGAMRDALSMLELFSASEEEVDEAAAAERLGVVGKGVVFSLISAICEGDTSQALEVISTAYDNSKDLGVLCSELSDCLRDILIVKYSKEPGKLIDATDADIARMKEFSEKLSREKIMYCAELCEQAQERLQKAVFSRRTVIENTVIRLCEERLSQDTSALLARISKLEEKLRMIENGGIAIKAAPADIPAKSENAESTEKSEKAESAGKAEKAEKAENTTYEFSESDIPPEDPDAPTFSAGITGNSESAGKTENKEIRPTPLSAKLKLPDQSEKPKNREYFGAFAEFVEEVTAKDVMTGSMLEGGKIYINDKKLAEIEVGNPVAPMIIGTEENRKMLAETLSAFIGYLPEIKIVYIEGKIEDKRPDLSSLL